jgi:hypothetical protein
MSLEEEYTMKFAPLFGKVVPLFGIGTLTALLLLAAPAARAMELDYLQDDSRFTGGEYNGSPSQAGFWFYDQYTGARNALQGDGVALVPVSTVTLPNLNADSDAFYIPTPANTSASTYPMTSTELNVLKQYVGQGHSVIFDLSGASGSEDQVDDLLSRLGLDGESDGTVSGTTSFPLSKQPIIKGVIPTGGVDGNVGVGAVSSFNWSGVGDVSGGELRSLVSVNGDNVLPYVEKGDLSSSSGAYFFLLDGGSSLMDFSTDASSQQKLVVNLLEYSTTDQYLHYVPSRPAPPGGLLIVS